MLEIIGGELPGRVVGHVRRAQGLGYGGKVADDEDQRVYVLAARDVRYRVYMVTCGVCGQAQGISTERKVRDEIVQECVCGAMLILRVEALRADVHRGVEALGHE